MIGILNRSMKPIIRHTMKSAPIGSRDQLREVANQQEYVVRKLHDLNKIYGI